MIFCKSKGASLSMRAFRLLLVLELCAGDMLEMCAGDMLEFLQQACPSLSLSLQAMMAQTTLVQ